MRRQLAALAERVDRIHSTLLCGDVEEVIEAFRDGLIEEEKFAMPGCCGKPHRDRRRQSEGFSPKGIA